MANMAMRPQPQDSPFITLVIKHHASSISPRRVTELSNTIILGPLLGSHY